MKKDVHYSRGKRIENNKTKRENNITVPEKVLSPTQEMILDKCITGIVDFMEMEGGNVILYVILKLIGL